MKCKRLKYKIKSLTDALNSEFYAFKGLTVIFWILDLIFLNNVLAALNATLPNVHTQMKQMETPDWLMS